MLVMFTIRMEHAVPLYKTSEFFFRKKKQSEQWEGLLVDKVVTID